MITAVSLNPSIDRTLEVERLEVGGLNRIAAQTDVAAGKGVNVALAASALGEVSSCLGLMYSDGAALFDERLSIAGVKREFVCCDGAVRVNTKLFDRSRGEITELNSSGVCVTQAQLAAVSALIQRRAREADLFVLTGSLPPGCPVEFYRTLAMEVSSTGCRVILDADGEYLRLGLQAKPFLVKPNRRELECLLDKLLPTRQAVLEAALQLIHMGVGVVAVSLGVQGALITDGHEALFASGLNVDVRSTVGAGDSMVAGLAVGFMRAYKLEDTFRLAVAAATARCATPPQLAIPLPLVLQYTTELTVEKLI